MSKIFHSPVTVVHELPRRLRLRCRILKKPSLDPDFFEATLSSLSGVDEVRVNSLAGTVVVVYDGLTKTRSKIINSLHEPAADVFGGDGTAKTLQSVLSLIWVGGLALSTLFLSPVIAASVAVIISAPTIVKGIVTLCTRGLKVEVLDGTAVLFCLIRRDFFTAGSIVFLLSAGEYIEELSENKSTGMLKNLLRPQVSKIWIEVEDAELEISLEDAKIGDRVICGAGELIPLDGKVVKGEATVNSSSISGESVPVPVEPGSEVLSGSVVEEGRIVFEASHVGSDTSMARITGFLENSLRFASDSQRQSDELADKLVPISFGLGVALLAVTRDLNKAAAVLTVDYSCAIKLANPVAVRSAMVTAAGQGVLLKGSQAMDGLAKLDTLVFDKTGTLTHGQLQVTDFVGHGTFSDNELLVLAASAEEHYSHPVASAVVHAAKERNLALSATSQVDFIVAHGVSAYIDGNNVLVGSRHFIETDEGVDCSDVTKEIETLQKEGKSLLYVSCAGKLAGIIGMRDELRAEANDVLNKLKDSGIKKILILTGDAKLTADALALMRCIQN